MLIQHRNISHFGDLIASLVGAYSGERDRSISVRGIQQLHVEPVGHLGAAVAAEGFQQVDVNGTPLHGLDVVQDA
ncbi:MAG TPA: hypothetical protein VGP06_11120 [Janthinobacterium sp.]|nr:hypothetical protein [Janthinobacterium sp.]